MPGAGPPRGNFVGILGPLRVHLHLTEALGVPVCLFDVPAQRIFGMECMTSPVSPPAMSFEVPAVKAKWVGVVGDSGVLRGQWMQGRATELSLSRDVQQAPPGLDGTWIGTLMVGTEALRIEVRIATQLRPERLQCDLASLDQGARFNCDAALAKNGSLTVAVPSVAATWEGRLTKDGVAMIGTWRQGSSTSLNFVRRIEPTNVGG